MSDSDTSSSSNAQWRITDTTTITPPTITSTRPSSRPGLCRRRAIGSVASVRKMSSAASRLRRRWLMRSLSLASTPSSIARHRPHRARGADQRLGARGARHRAVDVGEVVAHDRHRDAQLLGARRIRVQHLLGQAHAADVDRDQAFGLGHADGELRRAAAHVDDQKGRRLGQARGRAEELEAAPPRRRSATPAARRAAPRPARRSLHGSTRRATRWSRRPARAPRRSPRSRRGIRAARRACARSLRDRAGASRSRPGRGG